MLRNLLLLFSLGVLVVPAFGQGNEFWITDVHGDAAVVANGAARPGKAVEKMPLETGDTVVTRSGGGVEIANAQGTLFRLRENSSFKIEEAPSGESSFRLKVGRLLARFAKSIDGAPHIQLHTPVAVAAIRGTELVLDVADNGLTNAAVSEGEVAFDAESDVAASTQTPSGEVDVKASEGAVAGPDRPLEHLPTVPPILVSDLAEFPAIRERVPALRDQIQKFSRPEGLKTRIKALRDGVTWTVPEKLHVAPAGPAPRAVPPPLRAPLPERSPRRP